MRIAISEVRRLRSVPLFELPDNSDAPSNPAALFDSLLPRHLRGAFLFAIIFSCIWILHAPLLRLPYFWDEAGYFIPAARDLWLTGNPIPTSTLSNAHPPLVMAWLAFWWKFSSYTPAVTRTAMLLVAAFALLGVFRLARQASNLEIAVGATLLTGLYPVFFAQSSLAHLDMAAAGFTLWALGDYLDGKRWRAIAFFGLGALAKETAMLAPAAIIAWEGADRWMLRLQPEAKRPAISQTLALSLSALPLAGWLAYHYIRTGIVFGNPEYIQYNVGTTMNAFRILLAFGQRIWHLFGYLNLFVLTGAAALAVRYPPLRIRAATLEGRPRIPLPVQSVFAMIVLAYALAFSIVGGAVLARYLLPVYPLVMIEMTATLWRRLAWWKMAVALVAVAFVLGWFTYPPYHFAPEDNLAYADFVRLHKDAAARLTQLRKARVLTAWPATDELTKPYLRYVKAPVVVVQVQDFTDAHLQEARASHSGEFNYIFIFSSKYEPSMRSPAWWSKLQTRYFDFRRGATPEETVAIFGGRIIYQEQRGGEWVAIIEIS